MSFEKTKGGLAMDGVDGIVCAVTQCFFHCHRPTDKVGTCALRRIIIDDRGECATCEIHETVGDDPPARVGAHTPAHTPARAREVTREDAQDGRVTPAAPVGSPHKFEIKLGQLNTLRFDGWNDPGNIEVRFLGLSGWCNSRLKHLDEGSIFKWRTHDFVVLEVVEIKKDPFVVKARGMLENEAYVQLGV